MSYLRWSYSNWYIFWHANGEENLPNETAEDQLLAIWHVEDKTIPTLTYDEVVDIYFNPEHLQQYTSMSWERLPQRDKDELIRSIKEWFEDVHETFGEPVSLTPDE